MADKAETAAAAKEAKGPKTFADDIPAGAIAEVAGACKLPAENVKEAINGLKLHPASNEDEAAVAGALLVVYGPGVKYGDGVFFPTEFDLTPQKGEAPKEAKGGDKK